MENDIFSQWASQVSGEIERVYNKCEDVDKRCAKIEGVLTEFRVKMTGDIASLKTKAGVWGAIAGMIPVVLTLLILVLKGKL